MYAFLCHRDLDDMVGDMDDGDVVVEVDDEPPSRIVNKTREKGSGSKFVLLVSLPTSSRPSSNEECASQQHARTVRRFPSVGHIAIRNFQSP